MFMEIGVATYVYVCTNVYRVVFWGDRVLKKEGVGFWGKCVCQGLGVCVEGVETDSRIPFALVSLGLDQV